MAQSPEELRAKNRQYRQERYAADAVSVLAYNRAWYFGHHEQALAGQRARYAARKAHFQEVARQRRATNGEAINAQRRANHAANPEKARAKQRTRRAKNVEHINAQTRTLYHANPGKKMAHNAKHRAAKRNAPVNDLTHEQWLEIQEAQEHRCYYCRKRRKGKLTQDHIQPLSEGGSHTLHNVIATCQSCNSKKGTGKPPIPVQPLLLTVAPARKPKAS